MVESAFNSVKNAIFGVLFLFTILGLAILFTIGDSIDTQITSTLTSLGMCEAPYCPSHYAAYKTFFLSNLTFMSYFFLLLMLYSSFANSNNMRSYLTNAVATLLCTVIVGHIGTLIWNQISAEGLISFGNVAGVMWWATNFQIILLLNAVAGALSFVFHKPEIDVYGNPVY